MKHHAPFFFKLLVALLFTSHALHAGLPAQAQAFAVEFIKNPAPRFKSDPKWPEQDPEVTFASLRAIYTAAGEEAVAPLAGKDMPTLEEELALIGRALTKEPEKAKELRDWYGCHWISVDHALVESYYLTDADRKAGKKLEARKLSRAVIDRRMEPLHKEHAAEAYRLFWEAWLLVDQRSETGHFVNMIVPGALITIGSNKSLPVLQYHLESYIRECPSTDDHNGVVRTGNVCIKLHWIFKVTGRIGSDVALRSLLRYHDRMIASGFAFADAPGGVRALQWNYELLSISQLVWLALTDPEDNVAQRNKPVIEAALKQKDLKPAHRALLEEALKIIQEREAKGP